MEFLFLLLIFAAAAGVVGGVLYLTAAWLRRRKLSRSGDLVEGERGDTHRPEHVRVDSEQRAHFVSEG